MLPDLTQFQIHLKNLYSGVSPSKATVNNIHKEKCLFNSLYSDFKTPLRYAKILIQSNDVNPGDQKSNDNVGGFLVDASFLWEMYLLNLMRRNLPNWTVDAQFEISFYEDTFYHKNNYPDFVLRNNNTGEVFVLDAKFKRMTFDSRDVDNEDIRQLHAYSYYFHLKEGDKFKGAG